MSGPSATPPSTQTPQVSFPRQVAEFFTCLTIAVCLFKTFLLEGYVIPTGSMAPTLLGRHLPVQCPHCGLQFAVGTSRRGAGHAACPNCDTPRIPLSTISVNEGDQLLVQKSAYEFRLPQRWEAAVFRNPQNLNEAYVKRVVGLPGEEVELIRGDVYINGELARKPLSAQRACAILVHDAQFVPTQPDPDWKRRWMAEQPWWQTRGAGFAGDTRPEHHSEDASAESDGEQNETESENIPRGWLTYRHWLRAGGRHLTRVKLEQWPSDVPEPKPGFSRLDYDADSGVLSCRGVLTVAEREDYRRSQTETTWERALDELCELSHQAPITDFNAYNALHTTEPEYVVRDLLLQITAQYKSGQGDLVCEISDGHDIYQIICETQTSEVRLQRVGESEVLRSGRLPAAFFDRTVRLEFSNIDQQICCALDGQELFEPYAYDRPREPPVGYPRRPLRIGISGLRIQLHSLRVYRDLYYTPDGASQAWRLENSSRRRAYFTLGDNSPISIDSRFWPESAAMEETLLIGKPFLVHLPTRTWPVQWLGRSYLWRLPEWSRIRWVE